MPASLTGGPYPSSARDGSLHDSGLLAHDGEQFPIGIETVILMSVVFPYVSPLIRFPAEVQPWAPLLAWMSVLWMTVSRVRPLNMRRGNLALVVFGVIFLVHVNPAINASLLFYVRKSAAFLLGVGLVFLGQRMRPSSLGNAVLVAVVAYAAFAVLQYASEPLFWSIVSPFVPLRDTIREDRGAASLAPEATDFGFTAVYLFLFALLVRGSSAPNSRAGRYMPIAAGIAVVCVLLSKSGSGVIALASIALTVFVFYTGSIRRSLLWLMVVGVCVALAATASSFFVNNRGVALLLLAINEPELLLHTTFSYRFIHNLIGVIAVVESKGLGFGAGSFLTIGPQLYAEYGLAGRFNLPEYYAKAMERTLATNPSSVIAQLLVEYGLLGIAAMLMLFHRTATSKVRLKWACALMLFFTWAQSFPLAYPPFWLLLGLIGNDHFFVGRKEERQANHYGTHQS